MSLVSPTQVSDGTTADASDVNTPINQLAAVINGNIDNSNIVAGAAIDGAKLAANSIDIGAKASTWDGWIAVTDTWTYASSTTVTVPSDATAKYSVGDKVKFVQTSTKYFYITAVASTTLTLNGGSDYTVANAAISSINYSKAATPLGFPGWFNFTPTVTASAGGPFSLGNGTFTGQFSLEGKKCFVQFSFTGGSTTTWGTGTFYIDYPITCAAKYNTTSGGWCLTGYCEDLASVAYSVHSARTNNSTRFQVVVYSPATAAVGVWSYNAPFTWATGDFWMASGFYEVA